MKIKELKYILTLLLLPALSFAQSNNEELSIDTFRVVKEYKPILIDADKIQIEPEINDTFKLETKLDYTFIQKPQPISFVLEPIKPARIKGEPLVKLYNGYARVGVGNSLLPFAEVYYTNKRSKKFALGTHVRYINQAEMQRVEDSDFSKLHLEVFGKRFWKRNTLDAKLAYDLHQFNYYGFNEVINIPQIDLPAVDLGQQYNQFSTDLGLKSTKQDSFNLRHDINIHHHYLSNQAGLAEQQFKVEGALSQFVDQELYQLNALVDYNKYETSEASTIVGIQPQISTIGERFRVNAGLGIYMNIAEEADFHFYPIAEVKYNVVEDLLVPYAGIKGQIQRNSYQTITADNPFVAEQLNLLNSNQKYRIYGGLRGTLSSDVSFNVSAAHQRTDNAVLYIKPSVGQEVLTKDFQLVYDQIDELHFQGELAYRQSEKLQLFALGEYFQYDTKNELRAWHRPEIKINLRANYNLKDKIIAKASVFYWGEQYARGVSAITINQSDQIVDREYDIETLDAIVDLNLGFEYRYTKKLSAFIDFNNLLGLNYERYQDYPLQGFNFWGGFTYAF